MQGSDLAFLGSLCRKGTLTLKFGEHVIRLDQNPVFADTSTCIWPSALRLSELIFEKHDEIKTSLGVSMPKVLELGCGRNPLVSIASALRGMTAVATDRGDVIAATVIPSDVSALVVLKELDWKRPVVPDFFSTFDLIVAADVLYDRNLHADLVARLRELLVHSKPSSFALLCWQIRSKENEQSFLDMLKSSGLSYSLVRASPQISSDVDIGLTLDHFKLTRVIKVLLA